jgi:hypothetical protein
MLERSFVVEGDLFFKYCNVVKWVFGSSYFGKKWDKFDMNDIRTWSVGYENYNENYVMMLHKEFNILGKYRAGGYIGGIKSYYVDFSVDSDGMVQGVDDIVFVVSDNFEFTPLFRRVLSKKSFLDDFYNFCKSFYDSGREDLVHKYLNNSYLFGDDEKFEVLVSMMKMLRVS